MQSVTIEYQRFGGRVGVLAKDTNYLRTVDIGGPVSTVNFPLAQQTLTEAMKRLDYGQFRLGDPDQVRRVAEDFLSQVAPILEKFLPPERPAQADGLYQLEVVTRAFELAQLPFEVLEGASEDVVITRRIRQPWPRPAVVRDSNPRVLFAWAEPKLDPTTTQRMNVPHARHLTLLEDLLRDWGGSATHSLDVLENATIEGLAARLGNEKGYTHIHLLAHGIGPSSTAADLLAPVNLAQEPEPTTFLALEGEDGSIDRCPPKVLAGMFGEDVPRPASFAIATCQSGEVKSIESGGTLAHALHEAGIPVVLASQLALTQAGSDRLISTFFAKVVDGDDPRKALRKCRDELRATTDETYYDKVALVGYIHLEEGFEDHLPQKKFEVALARLEAASRFADECARRALEEGVGPGDDFGAIEERFAGVRQRLEGMSREGLTKEQLEELHGLQASSLKREAETAWRLGQALSGDEAEPWRARSREALAEASTAYARAAKTSRDHHWTWVQWLALEATVHGDLSQREEDWIVSRAAAQDYADREPLEEMDEGDKRRIEQDAVWARGSLAELYLLSPLTGGKRGAGSLKKAKTCLAELAERCDALGDGFPIESTLRQLARYTTWWGADDHWKLPAKIVKDAKSLHAHLTDLRKGK